MSLANNPSVIDSFIAILQQLRNLIQDAISLAKIIEAIDTVDPCNKG